MMQIVVWNGIYDQVCSLLWKQEETVSDYSTEKVKLYKKSVNINSLHA